MRRLIRLQVDTDGLQRLRRDPCLSQIEQLNLASAAMENPSYVLHALVTDLV